MSGDLANAKEPVVADPLRLGYDPPGVNAILAAGKPGSKLSLQKHFHRSEHWVVVKGTAEVTLGSDVRSVHENESIYIPIGSVHRLANPGKIPLDLVEMQVGSYLGEDGRRLACRLALWNYDLTNACRRRMPVAYRSTSADLIVCAVLTQQARVG
jgi:quercetin dioxygenase-like cupin family protein